MGNRHSKNASTKRSIVRRGRQPVGGVSTQEVESVRNNNGIAIEELKKEWNNISLMLSFFFNSLSCDLHEDCDGTCSHGTHYPGPPLIDGLQGDLFSMLSQIATPRPSRAAPQDFPRDFDWVEQQGFPKFEYPAISSLAGEIRLLRIKKGLFRSDIVECDIITTTLGQGQEFQALSYRWGSGKMSDVMLCNGKKLYIYSSLNAALKTFRESPMLRDQLLWSDAVSIDQANKAEVGEQILLMRRIYTEATGVFVHLGLAERKTSLGLDLMHRLATLQRHLTHPEQYGAIPIDDVTIPSEQHPCWTEYFTLFLSPWISRTWILQEIALSKKATLGIGRYVVDWEVFEDSFTFLKEHGFLEGMGRGRDGLMLGILNFLRLQEIRDIARSPDDSSLMKVLRATRNFEVTDPRDKVVGVLGVIGDLPPPLKAVSDRSLNTPQVYHRTALYLLETPSLPDVFAHAGLQRRVGQPDMPSWVPDWYADNNGLNERPLTIFRPTPFLAGGRPQNCLVGKIEDQTYPRELLTPGFCHHRIIRRSDAFDHPKPGSEGTRLMSQSCFAWLKSARMCLEGSKPLVYANTEEAFARTLLVDDLYTGANAIRAATAIKDVVKTFQAAISLLEAGNLNQGSNKSMRGTTGEQVQTFLLQMMAASRCRRFAITDTGYMCLAPSQTEIGDAVAILFGFPTPFTMRLEKSGPEPEISETGLERVRARLVGDTYMHGVMYAESFTEAAQTGRPPCEIILI